MSPNTPPNNDPSTDPVPAEYIKFDSVAEKTWQVILNDGFANIVIDLLTVTDPGPAKRPEVRVYTEQPRDDITPDAIRDVTAYPQALVPNDAEPDAVWKSGTDETVAVIRVPHEGDQLPVIEVDFGETRSTTPHVTVYELNPVDGDNKESYTIGEVAFSGPVNTETDR